ncbi:trypco2 family protein [Pseudomonas nitroreducens]|uniref:Trypsin-co-occurring domain-containing protein n=1 Tax=Pseudomonas nitroreducens TaxID=46680 RepID=A0A2D0ADR4_PSENT|nr:trypco2 family protein [Pseudomonas nitroreducens]OWP50276.1 hypothetical protein CEG18_12040 [Pseudomonas nitroreducens]
MKGNISLTDFIKQVKEELKAAIDDNEPFFEMGDVELEVSFAVEAEGSAKFKFYVLDIGGKAKASQTHVARIKLHPFVEDPAPQTMPIRKPTVAAKSAGGVVLAGATRGVSGGQVVSTRAPRASHDGKKATVKSPSGKPKAKSSTAKPT